MCVFLCVCVCVCVCGLCWGRRRMPEVGEKRELLEAGRDGATCPSTVMDYGT